MSNQPATKPSAFDRVIAPWWVKILLGLAMFFFAYSEHEKLSKVESGEKDRFSLGRGTRMLYTVGGKWLPIGVTTVVGVGFIAWGGVQLAKSKK